MRGVGVCQKKPLLPQGTEKENDGFPFPDLFPKVSAMATRLVFLALVCVESLAFGQTDFPTSPPTTPTYVPSTTPAYDYLFGGDSIPTPALQTVEQAFAKAGLNGFAIDNGRVEVPHSQRATYLAALADAKALPPTPAPKTPEIRHAQEEELSLVIASMKGIERASVMIDTQNKAGFESTPRKTASVLVLGNGGMSLDDDQIDRIRNYVAGAIPGIKPENVAILDANGRVGPGDDNSHKRPQRIAAAPKMPAPKTAASPYGSAPATGTPATMNSYTSSGNPYGNSSAPKTPAPVTPSTPYLTPAPASGPIIATGTPPAPYVPLTPISSYAPPSGYAPPSTAPYFPPPSIAYAPPSGYVPPSGYAPPATAPYFPPPAIAPPSGYAPQLYPCPPNSYTSTKEELQRRYVAMMAESAGCSRKTCPKINSVKWFEKPRQWLPWKGRNINWRMRSEFSKWFRGTSESRRQRTMQFGYSSCCPIPRT